jgi:ABC-2 type transport system permease protein
MFLEFFRREVKQALKQPMVYIFLGLLALLVFGAVVSDNVSIGGSVGNVNRNAPHIVTIYTCFLGLFGLLFAVAFFNNAALRDYSHKFNEILFSTPLKKADYFFGRFFGAFLLSILPFLGIFLGVWLGTFLGPIFGWMPAERMGAVPWAAFLNNYLIFILPNMFFAGAILFALATRFRSTVVSFTGALAIIIAYFIGQSLMSDIENESIAALTDFFGISTYFVQTKYYTAIEKNTLVPSFTGLLLVNRLIWMAAGVLILLAGYFTFSFKKRKSRVKKKKVDKKKTPVTIVPQARVEQLFTGNIWLKHFRSFFRINFLSMVRSNVFRILFLFCLILLVSNLWGGFEYFGLKSYPVTYKMIDSISGNVSLFLAIIMVFFSGELVWRERDVKINEVVDTSPHHALIPLLAKAAALIAILVSLYLFTILIAVGYQLLNGFTDIKFGIYLAEFFINSFPGIVTSAFILLFIQVLVNHKYLGYFVSLLFLFGMEILLQVAHIESRMLSIGDAPTLTYSDMSGFGPGVPSALWFSLYWLLFSLILIFLAGLIWPRGANTKLKTRLRQAGQRLKGKNRLILGGLFLAWLLVAAWVYYNTQILNEYKTSREYELLRVDYENKYSKFKGIPQPKITDTKYFIDIFPYKRDVTFKAEIKVENKADEAIDSLHFILDEDWNHQIEIPGSKEVFFDEELGYQIFQLENPLDSGQTLDLTITGAYITKGFENSIGNTQIVSNGTFFNNLSILPSFGYSESYEISSRDKRKKYDLPPKEVMPKLESPCGHACMNNYLTNGIADWVNVETTISTAGDQTAIAPGSLMKKWEEDGRNYFHYKVDHPSQNFYSFTSARFEVARRKWKDVDIEVYYDAQHSVNVEKMLNAVERSLAYYTENFGPYFHKQARIIEFPRYATFAQAFPGTMPYSESFGFIINLEDETKNNIIDAVIAHEMAHQWWAHQEISANMQGATMLTESLSEYSSLMVMKSISDDIQMRQFLKYDINRYLNGRGGDTRGEPPLYKVENQSYIHYGKGSVILYALQDYIGEDSVNTALSAFLEEYRYQEPPYPTSLDLLRHLEARVPDSLQYLMDDWFREITLYDFRLKNAGMQRVDNDKYKVTMELEAYKIKADSVGKETVVPVDDWVDIGLYADADEEELILQKRVRINSEESTFELIVDEKPVKAAIDPRRLLIERITDDNTLSIQ